MILIFDFLLLLTTFVAMSHGYNFMAQFQPKFRKCIACTVLISSMGTSIPSISFANEASLDLAAPTTTAKIRSFKLFVKNDDRLEQEVKLAEKEAREDAKVCFGMLFDTFVNI